MNLPTSTMGMLNAGSGMMVCLDDTVLRLSGLGELLKSCGVCGVWTRTRWMVFHCAPQMGELPTMIALWDELWAPIVRV